jgi:AraC-like DNA-binding protein
MDPNVTDRLAPRPYGRFPAYSSGYPYLRRAFRARHGTSLHRYQRGLRLSRAAALLAQGHPPALAAAATGFADQSHLTRWLHATYGVSPGAWRGLTTVPATVRYRSYPWDDV